MEEINLIRPEDNFLSFDTRIQTYYDKGFKNIESEILFSCFDLNDLTEDEIDELNVFHAENIYTVEKNDEYFCGIRANHFVVEEGWSEYGDGIYYLISANHKGARAHTLLKVLI